MPKFLQPVSDLTSLDSIPEELGFVKDGIQKLLNGIFYKDLQFSKSPNGDSLFSSLKLICFKKLAVEIPGTGMFLVVNPEVNANSTDYTVIPIDLSYKWKILGYAKAFKLEGFSFTPADIFDLINAILALSEERIIEETLGAFFPSSTNPINDFVDAINEYPDFAANPIPYPTSSNKIKELVHSIETHTGKQASVVIFIVFLAQNATLNGTLDRIDQLYTRLLGGLTTQFINDLIKPRIDVSSNLSVGLEFPRNVLVPLDGTGKPLPLKDLSGNEIKSTIIFDIGDFNFSTHGGFGFDKELAGSLNHPSQIGNTGLKIDFHQAKLDLSKKTNIQEATLDGRPNDFVGVFIQDVVIGFPAFWQKDEARSNAEIFGKNVLIGTGGFSGTIGMRAKDPKGLAAPLVHTHFGGAGNAGFDISLTSFDIDFHQNNITHSDINGQLALPDKFKSVGPDGKPINARIVLDVAIAIGNGDFSITAKPIKTPLMFNIANVANFQVNSISVGKDDDRYYVEASGKIKIMYDTPPFANFLPEAIDIQCLRIWSDGQIEFRGTGGEFKLRKPITLRFPPVELSVTAIHLGSYEGYYKGYQRKYLYFGFDGSVSINPGGISGKGSGIKFYFTHDNEDGKPLHVFMRIQTIEIDLILPDEEDPGLLLQGILSMKDPDPTSEFPDPGPEYMGSVTFELPRIKMGGSAGMRLNPRVPAFLVDVSLEMSTPIILGATGLGIYGFRGLFGKEYIASKEVVGLTEEARWFDYYKKKVPPINKEGVDIGKFDLKKKGISVGVGVSLATSSDQGRAFSSKLFLLLSLPNAFLLQGQAQILKKQRLQLNDPSDPPFSLMLAVDDRSLSVTIGVNFLVPNDPESPDDSGKILTGFGEFDFAFFWDDASAWYLNFGRDDRPIQAQVMNLFRAYAYLMISGRGIKFGAGFNLDKSVNCGPMKIKLWAILDVGAQISFKPVQFGGFFALSGGVSIKIFGFGFGLSVKAGLAGEAPKPFIITGRLSVCVHVLRKEHCGTIELTWQFKKTMQTEPQYFITETAEGNAQVAKAVNMLTGEGFPIKVLPPGAALPTSINLDDYVIPVDSFIDIEFNKSVKGGSKLGTKIGGYRGSVATELIPPVKGKSSRVLHEYSVENIQIFCLDGSQWKPYDIYDALTPWDTAPFIQTTDTKTYPIGYWQLDTPGRVNKLSIMATTPVRFLRNANVVYENLGMSVEHLLCEKQARVPQCAGLLESTTGTIVKSDLISLKTGVKVKVFGKDGKVISFANVFNESKGLQLMPGSYAELYLPEPSPIANLKLSALTDTVNITYYGLSANATYTEIKHSLIPQKNLLQPVVYEDKDNPVIKIRIEPGACAADTGLSCGLPLPESALLLISLNQMASANTLATGDPYNGTRLYLDKYIQSEYLPSGYDPCKLHMEVQQYIRRRWTFIVKNSLNPGGARTATIKIGKKTITINVPAFNIANPVGDTAVIINTMKAGFILTKKFNIISQTANTLTIEAKDPKTDLVSIPFSNAFTHFLAPDSGRAFSYQNVLSFSNLRPDTDARKEGLNYGFLVDAALTGGDIVTIKGSTDKFPIVCCNGVTARYVSTTCTQATARLKELQDYREKLLAEYAYEQQLCTSLSQNISCQAESLPHCNRVTQVGLLLQTVNEEITSLNTYLLAHCSGGSGPGEGSICTTNVTVQDCSIVFYKVCWMKEVDYLYNSNIPDYQMLLNDTTALVSRFEKTIQPVWRPNTKYAILMEIRDAVRLEGQPAAVSPSPSAFYTYLFQTKGPVGHFHQYNPDYKLLAEKNQQNQFKLADLRHYVDLSRSYPNADGNLLSAKPIYFFDPKLYLFFKREYVYAMYQGYAAYKGLPAIESAMNRMVVTIKDPSVSEFAVPLEGNEALWNEDRNSVLPRDIRAILNLINSHDACMDIDLSRPKGVHLEIAPPELKPLKLYSAMYYAEFTPGDTFGPTEVLSYNFQTSRYRSFKEHIGSYILTDEDDAAVTKKAVFDVKLRTFTADDHTNVQQIITGTMTSSNPLLANFMHPYDRLVDGVFKLNLPAAVNLEFNIIRDYSLGNAGSDTIIGILVRSPEPFNDPKIPMDRLKEAIRVLLPDGTVNTAYNTILYSKDISSVFISTASLSITDVAMSIDFEYLTYTKDGFNLADHVTVAIDTPASVSKLAGTDCGRTEVNFTDVLKAVPVKDAVSYQFLIERTAESFSQSYTDVNAEALFPLGEISGLDYNRAYTVKIKTLEKEALTGIERLSSYGPTCTIMTRKLSFLLAERAQKYQYVNVPLTIPVYLLFLNGSRFAYNGNVTVTATGSTTGEGVVALTDGAGNVTLQNAVPENVQIGFTDSANTGYDVSDVDTIQFIEHATRYLISVPSGIVPVTTPGVSVAVTVKAVGPSSPANVVDLGYNKPVTLNVSGAAQGAGQVTIVSGTGMKYITNNRSQIVTLSLANIPPETLDVSDTKQIKFVRSGNTYTFRVSSKSRSINQPVTVTVEVMKQDGKLDTTFDIGIKVKAPDSVSGDQVLSILNGTGTVQVTRSTAGTVTVSLEDIYGTGLSLGAPIQLTFNN